MFSELVLGVVANIDNLLVGSAFGLQGQTVSHVSNLIIALCNCSATLVSMLAGQSLLHWLSPWVGDLIAAVVFIALGCVSFNADDSPSSSSSEQFSSSMSVSEAFGVGLSLSFSNLAGGVAAGLAGFSIASQLATMFLCSWLGISLGVTLGKRVGQHLTARTSARLAGIAFVSFGLLRIVPHLFLETPPSER
jgi:putative Mn2+ efflux pump MntP